MTAPGEKTKMLGEKELELNKLRTELNEMRSNHSKSTKVNLSVIASSLGILVILGTFAVYQVKAIVNDALREHEKEAVSKELFDERHKEIIRRLERLENR